jgi:hypothetical protein
MVLQIVTFVFCCCIVFCSSVMVLVFALSLSWVPLVFESLFIPFFLACAQSLLCLLIKLLFQKTKNNCLCFNLTLTVNRMLSSKSQLLFLRERGQESGFFSRRSHISLNHLFHGKLCFMYN